RGPKCRWRARHPSASIDDDIVVGDDPPIGGHVAFYDIGHIAGAAANGEITRSFQESFRIWKLKRFVRFRVKHLDDRSWRACGRSQSRPYIQSHLTVAKFGGRWHIGQ